MAITPITIDVAFLVAFAAGNFLYIGATDLIPLAHFTAYSAGMTLLLAMQILLPHDY